MHSFAPGLVLHTDVAVTTVPELPSPPLYLAALPTSSHEACQTPPADTAGAAFGASSDTLLAPCGVINSRSVLCPSVLPTMLRMTQDGAHFVMQTSTLGPMLFSAAALTQVRRLHHVGRFGMYKFLAADRLVSGSGSDAQMPPMFFPVGGD